MGVEWKGDQEFDQAVRTWCDFKGFHMNLLRLESGIKITAPQANKVEEMEG